MLKKKKLNFKQWMECGGKMKYRRGGDIASPISPNTNATSEYVEPERWVDDSAASGQRTAGSVISAVGGVASAINPLIGAAIGAIGGIVSGTAMPTVRENRIKNTNPYGYKLGGKIKDPIKKFTFIPGGVSESDSWVDAETAANQKKSRVASIQSDKDFYENEVRKEGYDPEKIVPMGVRPLVDPEADKDPYNYVRQYFNTLAREDQEKKYNRPKFANGGDLEALSEDSIQVKANNPSMTDSVETDAAMLDHNEVVTGSKVFSDSLVNPNTGNSFATDEARNQKLLGKFQKKQAKLGDTEYKDEGYLKKNSEALFENQEQLATMIGLRNPDGTPKQEGGMRFGGMIGKSKPKYIGGGPIKDPLTYGQEIDSGWSTGDFKSNARLHGSIFGPEFGVDEYNNSWYDREYYNENKYGLPLTASSETLKNELGMNSQSTANIEPLSQGRAIEGLQHQAILGQYESDQNLIQDTAPGFDGALRRLKKSQPSMDNYSATLQEIMGKGKTPNLIGKGGQNDPQLDVTRNPVTNGYVDNSIPVSGPPNPSATGTGVDKKGEFPFGEVGTGVGLVSNIVNKLTNRPTFVNYKDLGKAEIDLQDRAMQNIRQGESAAIGDATMEGKVARENLSNRSIQSRNANLRNIATGISKAKAGIRSQFASTLASAQMQSGQRRSAIEESNRQKDMNVDVINTQEADAVKTEAMKMDENVRKLLIEYQLGNNNKKTNDILATLLQTGDYEYDINAPEGGIKFKKKTKIR